MIGSLGSTEILVICAVALLIFGGKGLPRAARKVGSAFRELRDSLHSAGRELSSTAESEETPPKDPPA